MTDRRARTLDALAALLSARPGDELTDPLAALTAARPPWHELAACRDHPVDVFFPGPRQSAADARAICATCPVAGPCLDWALDQGPDLAGIWAGTSRHDRARLRADRAA